MKFFTAALAAVAAGSAMAAPLNARDCITTPAPAPTPEIPGPSCDHAPPAAPAPPAPVAHWAPSHEQGTGWAPEPAVPAPALVAEVDIDVQALLQAIISLKLHLQVLLSECVPKLQALVLSLLVEVDLKAILSLVLEIKGLFLEIEGCLKHLVVTVSAEVLAVIAVELHACLAIIGPIAGPIVQIALSAVAALSVSVSVPGLVAQITAVAGDITKCTTGFAGILHPLITLLL
ncbi:hypothetical protein B0H67DRAFT_493803 [Lasiosphaeris hirsuta]|uniref:Uncharacterized protein n=1 Tax=Lasiosphaeris hirsuta TaxID=260670 RepID=A0AA40DPZ8_9PEZI|nr:hypothetical protein B0H67DRAFT_493803 [Lasiosphaeris hirsuta]